MATQIIPDTSDALLFSVEYDATGLALATIYDNPLLGWAVDDTTPANPMPVIVGILPTPAPATGPILSPQWAKYYEGFIFVPNLWRGAITDFFTWLATNNGATRKLSGRLVTRDGLNAWQAWSQQFPQLVAP